MPFSHRVAYHEQPRLHSLNLEDTEILMVITLYATFFAHTNIL
jgi:hypothetical protein